MKTGRNFTAWWRKNSDSYSALFFDIDGTLISGNTPLPNAVEFIRELRNSQFPFCLLTNDGNHSREEKSAVMRRCGLDITAEDIVSCGDALTPYAKRHSYQNERFYIMGELGDPDYAEQAGIITVRNPEEITSCRGVIIGEGIYNWQKNINAVINYYIKTESRLMIVPNPDSYWPDGKNGGIGIGAGGKARFLCTILKEYGIKIKPVYLGKPYKPVYRCAMQMLRERFSLGRKLKKERIIMLGDSLLSDIKGANRAGFTSVLLLTGITRKQDAEKAGVTSSPDIIFEQL